MRFFRCVLFAALAALAACGDPDLTADLAHRPVPADKIGNPGPVKIVPGRTVYVPAYTGIRYYDQGKIYPLAVTLSVRNLDPERSIILEMVDFHGSAGELVDRYLTKPVRVEPLGTEEFFIPERDLRGGSSGHFLVTWNANGPVFSPAIESVMIGTSGTQGISFTAQGIVYEERAVP